MISYTNNGINTQYNEYLKFLKGRADTNATLNNVDTSEVVSTHSDGFVGDVGSGEAHGVVD